MSTKITKFSVNQTARKDKKLFLQLSVIVLSIISASNVLGQSKANPAPNSPLVVCTQATSAAAPSTVCDGGTTVLTLSSVDAGVTTYQWQLSTDGGTVWNNVVTGSGGTTNTYTSGALSSGTTYKFRCNTSGTCTVKASTVTTITPPTIAGGTPTATSPVCTGSTSSLSLAGETTAGCTRQWQQKIGAGAWANFGTGTDPQATGALTNPNSYTYQCIITHTASGCTETSTITAALVPDAAATVANAGSAQNMCGGTTATMAGNTPVVGTGLWTKSSGGGSVTAPGTSPTNGITGLTSTPGVFVWTITNGACSSTDNVTITKGNVIAGGAPSATAVCTGSTSSLTLAGETTAGCTRQWQQKIGAGAWANIGTGTDPQATGALTNPNSYTFQCIITETATGCTATSTTSAALVPDAAATVSAAGSDQTICAGNMAICAPLGSASSFMTANSPGGGETGAWTKQSGTSSVTTSTDPVTAVSVTTGSAVWRWTITNGACTSFDDVTLTQNTSSALISGTATAAPTTPCTGGVVLLGITGEYAGSVQWQQNVNAGGWTDIAGATTAAYTTGAVTNPNSYQYRVKFTAAGPCVNYKYSNTVTVTPATIPAAGASTNYTFTSPTLTLSTPMGSCTATYTFGQTAPATNAYINSGVTLTVSGLLTGTDATTMTSGSCGGVAINMATVVKTATSVSFTTPAALCGNFTIVLNGITNPAYGAGTGSASVSVPNRTTGTNSGTYTYYVADHVGDYFDYNGSMVAADITYTNQDDSAHCYHNLSVGVHCFSYINPGSGTITVGTIMDPGTSGCSSSNGGFAQSSGGGNAEAGSTQYQQLYVNSTCVSYPGVATAAGSCLTTGATYTMCFTVPAGCAGENFCPLINCSTGNCGNSALPIELLYFDAKLNGRVVDLHWATSSEINNDFFTVERTMDGNVFFSFVEVKGAGNSTSPLQYSSVDEHPFPGISYYRLKQTDYDGKFAYSQLVAINRNDLKELDIKYVLGNKDRNALQYQLSSANDSGISITVFDVLGKIVLTDRIGSSPDGQTLYMDASGLSRGVYIMKVSDGEHMAVKKFLY